MGSFIYGSLLGWGSLLIATFVWAVTSSSLQRPYLRLVCRHGPLALLFAEHQWVKRMLWKNRNQTFTLPFCCSTLQFRLRQTKPNSQSSSYRHEQRRFAGSLPEPTLICFYRTCKTDVPAVPEYLPALSLSSLRGCCEAGRCHRPLLLGVACQRGTAQG